MKILPAIDLLDGKCVRLRKGNYDDVTVYSDDPAQMARKWVDLGAEALHLVDLDGAKAGKPVNREAIKAITKAAQVPVELGGGVRSVKTVGDYLDLGVSQVILGTAAIKTPDLVLSASDLFPDRILIGIDVKDGKPAIGGWLKTSSDDPVELAEKFAAMGAAGIIYTDISRDGMLEGANIEGLKQFAQKVDLPVTASGGVTSVDDVKAISKLLQYGVTSMIIGKALYDGALDLQDALKAAAS
ncbi:Phosphoribosylformimino-5-aminoimidazole carboxamide ribotide isomerase [hydrothermal vent metagenome]|uniref:1-(5-phosphoribosyl)-5-[(5-phosphoribosylamino)methylideneamino]imidazole-4-carboxamideisomerase n=1 Tax=hydrothermal vent metagenome TaxID=652676 RepID=A0A3B1C6D6_9ZZZZ